jgi:hypothetical protein
MSAEVGDNIRADMHGIAGRGRFDVDCAHDAFIVSDSAGGREPFAQPEPSNGVAW